MIYIKQFFILLLFVFVGQIIGYYLNFPSSVLSLIIFFVALLCGVVKVSSVDAASNFLVKISPLFFIPFIVNVIVHKEIIMPVFLYFIAICIFSTVITMLITTLVISFFEKRI